MLNMALIAEKLKNITEKNLSEIETTEEFFKKFEKLLSERDELFEKFEKLLSERDELYIELEEAISAYKKTVNETKSKPFWDDEKAKQEIQRQIDLLQDTLEYIDADIASFKKDIEFFKKRPQATDTIHLLPILSNLIERLERIAEELDSIIENLELGLRFHKQLSKLEKGFKDYSKKAKKVNLSKKVV